MEIPAHVWVRDRKGKVTCFACGAQEGDPGPCLPRLRLGEAAERERRELTFLALVDQLVEKIQ